MSEPQHLAKFDVNPNNNFESEIVFRRCPFGNRKALFVLTEMFLDIQWEKDLINGLSVNKSMYSNPEDALWSPVSEDIEKRVCVYTEKKGLVYGSNAGNYTANDPKTGISFSLVHSPINCNISHCDILAAGIPTNVDKKTKRDIKAFLATLFFEVKLQIADAKL